jgi:general secretion pathway protein A
VYTEFFGLNEKPFSISPDPRYLYLSRRHADALAHLIYGISESGGFIQLTGEVGTGKTTLIRSLLQQLPEKADIALILNPQLSAREFLQSICQELRIPIPLEQSLKALIDSLNERLLQAHAEDRRTVLIVDEAQTLSPELLEQVRLLTNLETASTKLLQIILIGQPELRDLLDRPEMRQIAQRVTGRYHLEPLSRQDTLVYVQHRLKVAGAHAEVFSAPALRAIYRQTGGIPRLINIVADRALLAAYTEDRKRIGARLVRRAAGEVFGRRRRRRWWPSLAAGTALAVVGLTATNHWISSDDAASESPPHAVPVASAARRADTPAPSSSDATLGSLLARPDLPTDMATAARTLFGLWGIEYAPDAGKACDQAAAQHLKCLFTAGSSLGELRRIDRPSVLSLTDRHGDTRHVVLSGLTGDRAQLTIGAKVYSVPIADLTHYWYGDHLLLWRPAFSGGRDLAPGMRGRGVEWVRRSLAAIHAASADAAAGGGDTTLYDAELEQAVRAYQRARMLTVDGIVGAQTQIALRTDLHEAGIPTLTGSR